MFSILYGCKQTLYKSKNNLNNNQKRINKLLTKQLRIKRDKADKTIISIDMC